MSDYTKATNFAAKDALSSGDPDKKVKGTEINTEFDAIATAIATKADLNAPTFTGVVTAASGFVGPLTGLASTATKLATARAINGVNFDGSAAISVNLNNALTLSNGGAGDASGSTFDGSAAKTISYNSIGAPKSDGTGASGTWSISITGNAATASACSGNSATATSATTASHIAAGSAGDLLYQSGAGATTKLAIGSNTYILTSNGTAPVWTAPSSISVNYATSAGSATTATSATSATTAGSASYATTAGSASTATSATTAGSCSGNAATATKLSNDSGSPGSYSARGWVNFNGTGTVSIRASKNVSSITDYGAGDYGINWTTVMGSANYATAITASADPSWGAYRWMSTPDGSFASYQLSGSVRVGYQSGLIDVDSINVVAFV